MQESKPSDKPLSDFLPIPKFTAAKPQDDKKMNIGGKVIKPGAPFRKYSH